jgi:hypothetical protein
MAAERDRSLDERFAQIETLLQELRREVGALAPAKPKRGAADLTTAAEQWVRGLGWDETFDEAMVEEELARIERRLHGELGVDQRARLLELWRSLRSERYPTAA